jgi:hypothetical protein
MIDLKYEIANVMLWIGANQLIIDLQLSSPVNFKPVLPPTLDSNSEQN